MNPDRPVEGPTGVVPAGKSRLRIKSLMIWVGLVAVGLGWVMHTDRTGRALRADQAAFDSWIADFEVTHPNFKRLGSSVRASSMFFEMGRRCHYEFRSPAGRSIVITADLRSGPFHANRRVTFESPDRTVTWPFEDIERGRKVDLEAGLPEAFR